MPDLDQQIRAWVDAANDGVEPVSVDEVLTRSALPVPLDARHRSSRRRGAVAVIAVAAVALVALGLAQLLRDEDEGTVQLSPAPTTTLPPGWTGWTALHLGWSTPYPPGWSVIGSSTPCAGQISWTLISNVEVEPTTADGADCDQGWVSEGTTPPGFVGVEVGRRGSPFGSFRRTRADTPLPLDADAIGFTRPDTESPYDHELAVTVGSNPAYFVRVFAAPDASEADLALLRQVVAAVSWTDPGPISRQDRIVRAMGDVNTDTFTACMVDRGYAPTRRFDPQVKITGAPWARMEWGEGDQARNGYDEDFEACAAGAEDAVNRFQRDFSPWPERPGPSQSPADAERDGVIPAVAELPIAERAMPSTWFDAEEGTWALSQMPTPEDGSDGYDCTIGDPDGIWGIDYVCSAQYGEVLLVDGDGAVVRSYPLPDEIPTWITATPDAVYAGRTGDGGQPDSVIMRIDRETLEARVIVFPVERGALALDLDGWSVAPADADIDELVKVGDPADLDPSHTLVSSWVGATAVDLAAVEELFA